MSSDMKQAAGVSIPISILKNQSVLRRFWYLFDICFNFQKKDVMWKKFSNCSPVRGKEAPVLTF